MKMSVECDRNRSTAAILLRPMDLFAASTRARRCQANHRQLRPQHLLKYSRDFNWAIAVTGSLTHR